MAAGQRVLCVAAAAILLLLAGVACGERREPLGRLSVYPLTVQGAGDAPTLLARAPRRIVPLSAGLADILVALRRGGESVGGGPDPAWSLSGGQLVRRLRALRPDLIVAPSALNPQDVERAADATGAQLYVFPDTTVHDVERGLTQLGLLVDAPAPARALVHRLEREWAALAARVAGTAPARVFVDAGYGTTIGSRTLLGDLIRQARGVDVAGATPGPAPLTAAEVARLDPDVYLALSTSGTTLAKLRLGPFRRVRAIRDGRFAVLPASLAEAGPRLDSALALLGRALHPRALR